MAKINNTKPTIKHAKPPVNRTNTRRASMSLPSAVASSAPTNINHSKETDPQKIKEAQAEQRQLKLLFCLARWMVCLNKCCPELITQLMIWKTDKDEREEMDNVRNNPHRRLPRVCPHTPLSVYRRQRSPKPSSPEATSPDTPANIDASEFISPNNHVFQRLFKTRHGHSQTVYPLPSNPIRVANIETIQGSPVLQTETNTQTYARCMRR